MQQPNPTSLTIRFCNIASTNNKIVKVNFACAHITGYVETRYSLDYSDNIFADLGSYVVFRRPRNVNGGGVAIPVKKKLHAHRRLDLESADLKIIFIQISCHYFTIGCLYGPLNRINELIRMEI